MNVGVGGMKVATMVLALAVLAAYQIYAIPPRRTDEGYKRAIVDGADTNRPAFDVSDAVELMNPNATEDDIFLALAKHVPALSSPVGGTSVVADCIDENVNMNLDNEEGGVSRPNEWGRSGESIYKQRWLHSDMKDMAYFYVFKLYNQLIQKGDLK